MSPGAGHASPATILLSVRPRPRLTVHVLPHQHDAVRETRGSRSKKRCHGLVPFNSLGWSNSGPVGFRIRVQELVQLPPTRGRADVDEYPDMDELQQAVPEVVRLVSRVILNVRTPH